MVIRSFLPIISLETMHDPKEPVLLIALKIRGIYSNVTLPYLKAPTVTIVTIESLNNTACF